MSDESSQDDDRRYGPYPWIVGIASAIAFVWLMFVLATGSN